MRKLYIFSGAGLSAESNLATFRDDDGLWEQEDLNKVCRLSTWKANRELVFDFYNRRKQDVLRAQPNAAHRALAAWQQQWGADRVRLLTQNVDDLLERAGALEVTHLHGELSKALCTACGHQWTVPGAYDVMGRCPACNSLKGVKPGVVFFGERAPAYLTLARMQKEIQAEDILLAIGTAFEVVPAAAVIPVRRAGDALTWQVNPRPADEAWFGQNVALPATEGCAQLEVRLAQLMEAGA